MGHPQGHDAEQQGARYEKGHFKVGRAAQQGAGEASRAEQSRLAGRRNEVWARLTANLSTTWLTWPRSSKERRRMPVRQITKSQGKLWRGDETGATVKASKGQGGW